MMQVIMYQQIQLVLKEDVEKLNDHRQKIAVERDKDLEHHRQSARLARVAHYEWVIACSQWWVPLLAFVAGVIVAAPLWLNWPALVGCDRQDWVCTIGRVKAVKWVR